MAAAAGHRGVCRRLPPSGRRGRSLFQGLICADPRAAPGLATKDLHGQSCRLGHRGEAVDGTRASCMPDTTRPTGLRCRAPKAVSSRCDCRHARGPAPRITLPVRIARAARLGGCGARLSRARAAMSAVTVVAAKATPMSLSPQRIDTNAAAPATHTSVPIAAPARRCSAGPVAWPGRATPRCPRAEHGRPQQLGQL